MVSKRTSSDSESDVSVATTSSLALTWASSAAAPALTAPFSLSRALIVGSLLFARRKNKGSLKVGQDSIAWAARKWVYESGRLAVPPPIGGSQSRHRQIRVYVAWEVKSRRCRRGVPLRRSIVICWPGSGPYRTSRTRVWPPLSRHVIQMWAAACAACVMAVRKQGGRGGDSPGRWKEWDDRLGQVIDMRLWITLRRTRHHV